jgi:hypothetical protein
VWAHHPAVRDAFEGNDISLEHTATILNCVRRLPEDWKSKGEAILLEAARSVDPVRLGKVAEQLRVASQADESREAAEQRKYDDRWARLSSTFDGMIHLESDLNNSHLCTFHHWLVHHRRWDIQRDTTTNTICVRRT